MIAFLHLHACDVHQHTFNRSRISTLLWTLTQGYVEGVLDIPALTPKVGLQKLRAYKTWILSNSWATDWRMELISWRLQYLNAFQKSLDLMSLNTMKCIAKIKNAL